MTKRIFRAAALVAAAVLAACLTLMFSVVYTHFSQLAQTQLSAEAELAAAGVEQGGPEYLKRLQNDDVRMTWVDKAGNVLFDSQVSPGEMENHSDRAEIRDAMARGTGTSMRYSSTLSEKTYYQARRLSDGTVLRVSATQYTSLTLLLGMYQPVLLIFALSIVLAALLARRIAKRIVKPLNALNLDHPLENDTYEELAPLLERMEAQRGQIQAQLHELTRRKEEFTKVTSNMREGLLLLGATGDVLYINPAARRMLCVQTPCEGKDFLTVDRSRETGQAIRDAMERGQGEACLSRAGREYQLNASRIAQDGQAVGVALFMIDVTERIFAERSRREFTANVSHELKTPLQSIIGIAELMDSRMVKPEDMPGFISRIRAESVRLLKLIEDILRLSRLDEGAHMQQEEADLYALAREAVLSLKDAAEAKQVRVSIHGGSQKIHGVQQLVREIAYNLCDNAIKYNQEGGSVEVCVSADAQSAVLTVADTGIGIPREHQDRIFERFYRVDKSRSKASGGTGLGLSIVKHAARYLGAHIELESEEGTGTRVTVRFPNKTQEPTRAQADKTPHP